MRAGGIPATAYLVGQQESPSYIRCEGLDLLLRGWDSNPQPFG
jgi:hypothetical protein